MKHMRLLASSGAVGVMLAIPALGLAHTAEPICDETTGKVTVTTSHNHLNPITSFGPSSVLVTWSDGFTVTKPIPPNCVKNPVEPTPAPTPTPPEVTPIPTPAAPAATCEDLVRFGAGKNTLRANGCIAETLPPPPPLRVEKSTIVKKAMQCVTAGTRGYTLRQTVVKYFRGNLMVAKRFSPVRKVLGRICPKLVVTG